MIDIKNLSISYDKKVIEEISFMARPGEMTCLLGENGAGKSSIIKAIAGHIRYEGDILTRGEISYLNQDINKNIGFTVFETILIGRLKELGIKVKKEDQDRVREIIRLLGLTPIENKKIKNLSGGQAQLAFIGQALITDPDILLLDEPVNGLDLKNKYKILEIIKDICKSKNISCLLILHELDLVEKFADQIVVLKDKKIYKKGRKYEILTEDLIEKVYGVKARTLYKNDRIGFIIG